MILMVTKIILLHTKVCFLHFHINVSTFQNNQVLAREDYSDTMTRMFWCSLKICFLNPPKGGISIWILDLTHLKKTVVWSCLHKNAKDKWQNPTWNALP